MKEGDKFGRWTVIGKGTKPYHVLCQCQCGTTKEVYKSSLRLGKSKSCGCLNTSQKVKKAYKKTDDYILNTKFGRLTPIKRVNKKGRARYLCKCDCGNETTVLSDLLLNGKTKSCGCLKSETSAKSIKRLEKYRIKHNKESYVDGTSLSSLDQKKSKNNTTGYKGVSKTKSGKYRAYINLRREQKHLGLFDTLEEAAEARQEAEKEYFDPIKEKWEKEK